jgi:Esterase-like activity of phytase
MRTLRHAPARLALASILLALAVAAPGSAGAAPSTGLELVGSFFVDDNLHEGEPVATPTSAEIVDIGADGSTLLYTDALTARLGFVDVSDPSAPVALGALDLPGGPTSVAIHKGWALVGIVTSVDPDGDGPQNEFDAPTGELLVIDIGSRTIVRSIELTGQPDSIGISPDGGRYAAIVIENQRDEDDNDGFIPQQPGGFLQVADLAGPPDRWTLRTVDLTGLDMFAADDPEPEYVDINTRHQAVVSLQENNHLAVVDLRTASVIADFSAGAIDLDDIDATEEELGPQEQGLIELSDSLEDRRREPDAVQWIDDDSFATANEGDYEDGEGVEGGSRSFTIFGIDGTVEFEAGNSFEHAVVRAGHFPQARAENKGSEPEGLEVGHYKGHTFVFVASERADIVGVYDVTGSTPELTQLLPTGIGPEGLKFTHDGLLAVTSETDGAADGFLARPIITLFSVDGPGEWTYPQLESADASGLPIPWVAQSGLAGDPDDPDVLWSVSDSFLAQSWLYRIDVSSVPAVITERIPIGEADVDDQTMGEFDLEGVGARPEGGFWLTSEGRVADGTRPNLLIRTDADGDIIDTVALPDALAATATSSGFEGVAVTGTTADGDETLYVAIQGRWAASGDPANRTKIGRYQVATDTWTFARYPLDVPPTGTEGLSEITALPDGTLAIIERDNELGQLAAVKRVYGIDPASVAFAEWTSPTSVLPLLTKSLLRDAYDDLDAASISVPDKLEGLGVSADGQAYLVTDNDGVDENYGETVFLRLGPAEDAFGG